MADYHPLIARAVAGLDKNTGENRRALYERARTALVAQLRGVVPALEESEITRERLALEEAIRKVEAESARHARETARPTFIKRAEVPKREEPPRPEPPARPAVGPARPGATHVHGEARPAASPSRSPATRAATHLPAGAGAAAARPEPPPAPRRLSRRRRPRARRSQTLQDEAARAFRDVTNDPQAAAEARNAAAALRLRACRFRIAGCRPRRRCRCRRPSAIRSQEYGSLEPQVQPENLWALPLDARQPPPLPTTTAGSRRSRATTRRTRSPRRRGGCASRAPTASTSVSV